MAARDIVAIGGSAGSTRPLKTLLAGVPTDFPGSLFITTHVPSAQPSHLPDMLAGVANLPIATAMDGQPIEPGRIYVAPCDRHLLLLGETVRLGVGPRENMVRPAIDPMFRSAALSYGPRVVGVVLSGLLSDGVSGLFAIKAAGGAALVQHPLDAAAGDMPRAAIEATPVDHVVAADALAGLVREFAASEAGPAHTPPESLLFEVEVAAGARLGSQLLRRFATPCALTCPECQGVLSEVDGERPLRYRCQIGHAYTAEELVAHGEAVEEAIRVAMRVIEERVELVTRMAKDARASGRTSVAELYEKRAVEYAGYAATLRRAAMLSMRMTRDAGEEPG